MTPIPMLFFVIVVQILVFQFLSIRLTRAFPQQVHGAEALPAEDARKPARTAPRSAPPCPTTFSSLIDRTGSTQGIKLRISPPITAKTMIVRID